MTRLAAWPFEDLGFARVDHHRALRGGPEVVYGPGKTPAEAARIVAALLAMLNSCAVGVSVVNIDNGFGAGALAARILRR